MAPDPGGHDPATGEKSRLITPSRPIASFSNRLPIPAMPMTKKPDENDVVWVSLPVDLETFAWLVRLSEECHALPESVGGALLRDIRQDDEAAHTAAPFAVQVNRMN